MALVTLVAIICGGCTATKTAVVPPPEPPAFAGTSWLAEDIDGRGVIDMLQSTLQFESAERVGGNAGCNGFFGGVSIDDWAIAFGAMGSTRRACPAAVMDQEQRFLQALSATTRYRLDPATDLLYFFDEENKAVLRFSRRVRPSDPG